MKYGMKDNYLIEAMILLRPHQWLKNLFIIFPLFLIAI